MTESSKTSLEKLLTQDEKKAEEEYMLAQRVLSEASTRLTEAIEKIDMIGVKLAKEMLDSAQRSYETASTHREEIKKVRINIGEKGKSALVNLVKGIKKTKS